MYDLGGGTNNRYQQNPFSNSQQYYQRGASGRNTNSQQGTSFDFDNLFGQGSNYQSGRFEDLFGNIFDQYQKKNDFPNFSDFEDLINGRTRRTTRNNRNQNRREQTFKTLQFDIEITLEDLYAGIVRHQRIRDRIPDEYGQLVEIERVFDIEIRKGMKDGTKFTFKPTRSFPRTVTFQLKQKKHRYFTRNDDHLQWICQLTQTQVNTRLKVEIPLLNRRDKLIFYTDDFEIQHGSVKIFRGYGMPKLGKHGYEYGDLHVVFHIKD
jgi:DnaJ family protein B protein 5